MPQTTSVPVIVARSSVGIVLDSGPTFVIPPQGVSVINTELAQGNQIQIVTSSSPPRVLVSRTSRTASSSSAYTSTSVGTWYTMLDTWQTYSTSTSTSWTQLDVEINGWYNAGQPDDGNWSWNSPQIKKVRGPLIKKSVKSSIKRALKLIANFGMEEDVRIFLGGDSIEVSHPDSQFKFVLSKPNNLIRNTERGSFATPYKLELYTKTGVHVANLCVYMADTPILDQVLALAMFVKTGDEDHILRKANFNSLCSDIDLRKQLALSDPYLEQKLRVDSVIVDQSSGIIVPSRLSQQVGAQHA